MNSFEQLKANREKAKNERFTVTFDGITYVQKPYESLYYKELQNESNPKAPLYSTSDLLRRHFPDEFMACRAQLSKYHPIIDKLSLTNRIRIVRLCQYHLQESTPMLNEDILSLFTHYSTFNNCQRDNLLQNYKIIDNMFNAPQLSAGMIFDYGPVLNYNLLRGRINTISKFSINEIDSGIMLCFDRISKNDLQNRLIDSCESSKAILQRITNVFHMRPTFEDLCTLNSSAFFNFFKSKENRTVYLSLPAIIVKQIREKIQSFNLTIYNKAQKQQDFSDEKTPMLKFDAEYLFPNGADVIIPWDSFEFMPLGEHTPHNASLHEEALRAKMEEYDLNNDTIYTSAKMRKTLNTTLLSKGMNTFHTIERVRRGYYKILLPRYPETDYKKGLTIFEDVAPQPDSGISTNIENNDADPDYEYEFNDDDIGIEDLIF